MNNISKKQSSMSAKLFEDEEKTVTENEIKVVTLHKSKGDEFDYVFIPALTNKNLGFSLDEIKLKEGSKIIQNVQNTIKKDDELKIEIIDENLRLLYVGITRAKKKLYLTVSREYKIFNKVTKKDPSKCFEFLRRNNGHI